jgi:hypothetical protein
MPTAARWSAAIVLAVATLVVSVIVMGHLVRYLVELVTKQSPYDHIEHRNQQQAEERREQHPADHAGANFVTRSGACARRDNEREYAKDKGHCALRSLE